MKKLGFGTMRLPLFDKENLDTVDIEQFKKMVDIFLENGFTYFDTAYVYHNHKSENFLKEALVDRYDRTAYTVTTKLPPNEINSYEDRDRIFFDQLKKVGVEYFDYYLLHCIMHSNYYDRFEKYDCFNWIVEKKNQGYIKHIGFSFHDNAELLDEILTKHPEIEFVQLQINYLDWNSYDIQSKKCYDVCVKHGKKVIVMEPVKGGALANLSEKTEKLFKDYDANMSIPSWGIRFAASLENVFMVLSGMSDISQVLDNTSYMKEFKPLNETEVNMCLKAAEMINAERAVNCTACSYCTEGCPQEIKIPDLFKMYNRLKQTTSAGTIGRLKDQYKEFTQSNTNPKECIECLQCENACPQHLPITKLLKEVSKDFE